MSTITIICFSIENFNISFDIRYIYYMFAN
jgi:hypothetical protein